MSAVLYGVGVGPGDPELMTLKACRLIRENDVIALPGKEPRETVAYKIAVQAVPELADKELVPVYFPMVMDKKEQQRQHEAGARLLESYLDKGKNVVFLTLGDSTIYCTFSYIQEIAEADGYQTALVNGIPSFCAAAARLNTSLTLWNQPLHVMPATQSLGDKLDLPGNYVLMKSASHMAEVKQMIRNSGKNAMAVENCSMETEKVYRSVEEIPDDAGYFSLIIVKPE